MTFVSNIPVWVLPLFLWLLFLGLRATRTRTVPIVLICALPLLGLLTVRNIASLAPPLWIVMLALAVYIFGAWLGMRAQRKWIIARHGMKLEVRGEWVTLAAMMVLFLAGFALGAATAIAPGIAANVVFAAAFCSVTALVSGQFLGRAIASFRAGQSPAS